MKKRRRRRRSPPKVSRYRRVVGRLPHSMVALAVVTVGLTFGLASVGWAINGKPLLAGNTNTATQPTVLDKAGAGPALDLRVGSGPALAVNTTALVTNLNADQLDGMGADKFAQAGHKHSGADITSGKVGEPFIDDAITRDSEVPSLVGDSFATQSALNDEKAARQNADQTLQGNIDSEQAARTAADTALQENINQEASTRQNADNALGQGDGVANESSDPVDFTRVKNIPADIINRNADTIDGKNSSDFASAYKRTVVVSPVPNNPFASGAALESALAGITGASQSDPYLLKIEPGVYHLGAAPGLQMKQWVDIEGSGEVSTKIRCVCFGPANSLAPEAVVKGANNAELRFLTVENIGGGPSDSVSIAIRNGSPGASPRLTHVTAIASGGGAPFGASYGVFNNNSSPRMTDVTATASGGGVNVGVYNEFQSSPQMTDVTATGQGGNHTFGVSNQFNSSPRMTDVTATGSGGAILNRGVYNQSNSPQMTDVTATASGEGSNFGVYNFLSSSPQMTDVTSTASGGTESYGVYNNSSSSPVIEGGTFKASGASMTNTALFSGGTVQVNNTHMMVPSNAAGGKTVHNSAGGSTRIGASLLEGAGVQNDSSAADSLKCVASYNGNYDPLGADCT